MNANTYLKKYTEQHLQSIGHEGRMELRKQASKNHDLAGLLDIAIYRFINGGPGIYSSLLPEMYFLFGRSRELSKLEELTKQYSFALFSLPSSSIERAKDMLCIGLDYPYISAEALNYLEQLWCDSETYEWMDIIMYDADRLPRKLKRFDEQLLNKRNENFSEQMIISIWDCFGYNKEEENEDTPFYYDRKTNKIGKKDWQFLGKGEFVIENDKHYKDVNDYISETFGEEVALQIAKELMFSVNSVEEFQNSCWHTVSPQDVYDACQDSEIAKKIAQWFCIDFLQRCNK